MIKQDVIEVRRLLKTHKRIVDKILLKRGDGDMEWSLGSECAVRDNADKTCSSLHPIIKKLDDEKLVTVPTG